ncbi:MAG TPA: helix-turn-helix domain-containing protein, partial [Acidimicrobiales bacterium]|nr:helix-turn-helix domain-containing protein [Acidimicrobiales bacterium]
QRLTVVPAEPVPLATTVANVYREAQRYLVLAEADDRGSGLVSMKELRLYGVFAGIPVSDRIEFVRDTLGPVLDLPEHKARELLETLEAVYRCRGRIADAAATLHLHQNSVRYRLARVEELTGLSLDVPADRMQLELAMRLRRVATAELASLDDSSAPSDGDNMAERPASA